MQPETNAAPQRPSKPTYKFNGRLPSALDRLRNRRQWVTWDYVRNEKKGKWDKPPRSAHTGKPASINDPFAMGTFDQAAATARRLVLAGVGLVLKPDDEITGGDLDHCVNDSGSLSPLAAEVIEFGETYAEYSPSGEGIRLLAFGKIAHAEKDDKIGVEMYATGRYLTITGKQVEGLPDEIRPAPRTIAYLQEAVAASRGEKPRAKANGHFKPTGSDFFRNVNTAALARRDDWVPLLHPTARKESGTGAWRVTSMALGRDLEEDLSYHADGIRDHGEETGITAIDAVMKYGAANDATEAAMWLCQRLGIEPVSLGWKTAKAGGPTNGQASESKASDWPDPVELPSGLPSVAPSTTACCR